jgi:hypothetical protein
MRLTRSVRVAIGGVLVTLVAVTALAQSQRFGRFFGESPASGFIQPNPPYDGRFVFLRVNYETAPGGFWYGGLPAWSHGYPLAEQNLMRILNEVTYIDPHLDGIATVGLDSPELFKYPLAYIIEVGWWVLSDGEAASLRAYLLKGGFVLVDDFKVRGWGGGMGGGGWEQFEANMKRVMPEGRFIDLEARHPIFHSFFDIGSFDIIPQAYNSGRPIFRALFEGNDPGKRMLMMVNYNTDVSQFWEWSARGFRPIDETNEAYKLGVNYIMYGLTH